MLRIAKPTDLSHLVESRVGIPEADGKSQLLNQSWAVASQEFEVYANNTIEYESDGSMKVTYVDDSNGFWGGLRNNDEYVGGLLQNDIEIGKWYLWKFRVKVNTGTVNVRIYDSVVGANIVTTTNSNTDWEWRYVPFINQSDVGARVQLQGFGAGEIIWINDMELIEWDGDVLAGDTDGIVSKFMNNASQWNAYGTNVVEQDGNFVKCTFGSDGNGMYQYINESNGDCLPDIDIHAYCKYQIMARVKQTSGGNVTLGVYDGTSYTQKAIPTDGSEGILVFELTPNTTQFLTRFYNMSAGESAWVEFLSIKKITGLTAAWNDLTNNQLIDISGNGWNAPATNLTKFDRGVYFNGSDGSAEVEDFVIGAHDFSIAIRCKLRNADVNFSLMAMDAGANYVFRIDNVADELVAYVFSQGNSGVHLKWTSVSSLLLYHMIDMEFTLVMRFHEDINLIQIFINGELITPATFTQVGTYVSHLRQSDLGIACIARSVVIYQAPMDMYDARIFDYALSNEQIKQYHNSMVYVTKKDILTDFATGDYLIAGT